MEVVAYHEGLLPQLTQLVNDHMRLLPPGWSLTQEQVAYVISEPNAGWKVHFPDENDINASHTVCMMDSGRITAAANWFFSRSLDTQAASAAMTWLFGTPEKPGDLESLIGAFVGQAMGQKCVSAYFCPRFGFGVGWFGIPDVWPHVIEVVQKFGFEVDARWVIMTGQIKAVDRPSFPDGVQLGWHINEPCLEWELEAKVGDDLAGECHAWGIPAHFRGCPGFDEWITLEWLGVEEPYRRKGFGSRLIHEQMRFQAKRGIKNVIAWTETTNTAARKLNESLSFNYGPECWVFQMSLK